MRRKIEAAWDCEGKRTAEEGRDREGIPRALTETSAGRSDHGPRALSHTYPEHLGRSGAREVGRPRQTPGNDGQDGVSFLGKVEGRKPERCRANFPGGSNGLEGCGLCLPFSSRTKGKGPEVGRELRKSSCVTF